MVAPPWGHPPLTSMSPPQALAHLEAFIDFGEDEEVEEEVLGQGEELLPLLVLLSQISGSGPGSSSAGFFPNLKTSPGVFSQI